jgi:O-antigen/teichoic acid export membrane protein
MLKRENIVFLIFSILSITLGLLTTYLLSNYFSIEDFGKLQLLLTLIGAFSIFNLSGFDIVIQKQIFNKNDNIVSYVLKKIMPLSFILMIMVLTITYFVTEYEDLLLFVFIITSITLFDKTNAILNAKLKFKELRYLELITKIFLLFLAILVLVFNLDIFTYIVVFTLVSITIIGFRIFISYRYLNIHIIEETDFNFIKSEGIKTSLSIAYAIITNWSERLILGIIDPKLLAIFVIGQLFPRVLKDNVKVLLTPTLNSWASQGFEHNKSMIQKYQIFLWIFGFSVYIVMYVLVDFIISNYFIKYEESILVAQLLAIPLIFKFVETMKMSAMALSHHTSTFNKINNISNTIKLILVVILIPLFGISGAVISIVIIELIRFLLATREFKILCEGRK